ncbi:hypothetical protein Pan216_40630 [Planctomycetes bacterium Pan216]|uniref:HD/PDEase domain-containing protein n=1 Tax=Kolteria novifilia TaxID=2527975 RepID=A0A518B887_9BACT|nr:hypothetical protein Pan216_40630 [Planctomycetes bacterium Pan216]
MLGRLFSFGRKRRPTSRGESSRLKKTNSRPERGLSKYLLQLLIGALTVVGTSVLVSYGGIPFPFRAGDRAEREIRLKTGLKIANETKTRNEREAAASETALEFILNPTPYIDLKEELFELLDAVASQSDYEKLGAERSEWNLGLDQFKSLRTLVPDRHALFNVEMKLDKVFEPFLSEGVLDETTLPPEGKRNATVISVHRFSVDNSERTSFINRKDVLKQEWIKPDGRLHKLLEEEWPSDNGDIADTLFNLIVPTLNANLVYDAARTDDAAKRAREGVPEVLDEYPKGYLVVPQGATINDVQLRFLRAEHVEFMRTTSIYRKALHFLGQILIVLALVVTTAFYLWSYEERIIREPSRLALLCGLFMSTVLFARLLSTAPYEGEILPIAVTSLLLAIAYNRGLALVVGFSLSLLVSVTVSHPMTQFVVMVGGTSAGILALDSVRSRTKLIKVGFIAGISYALLSVSMDLLVNQPWPLMLEDAARRFGCGLIAGFLMTGSLPFIESVFGIVTDISLIELADTSHPLLQQLVQRAPGTYNHSVTVSIIAETAAKKIGCNSLLVRVGAMFHDVGKMLKPQYFIENKQADERNRHDQLAPAMSTLIIIGHVKDGADLGRQHHLPQPILDMIEQHHGTTLVDYFYHEATREMQASDTADETVEESSFRYPGPKPQHKEAAVLMLSDCVESASRALSEPTPARIEKLVHSLALKRLLDGQLSESGLTLEEVKMIEDSLTKSLIAVYHGRIKYPDRDRNAS